MQRANWILGTVVGLALAACAEPTTAPAGAARARQPQFGITGNDSAGLVWRSDSLTRGSYVEWYQGDQLHYLSFSEGMVGGQRVALVGYGVLASSPCWWDPSQLCYDALSWGWGSVDPKDVHGGAGTMAVSTNTAPEANPGFLHFNDPGGWVRLTVRQVPETRGQMHQLGDFVWGNQVVHYNVLDEWREATVTGDVEGVPIPPTATARLTTSWGHSTTRLIP